MSETMHTAEAGRYRSGTAARLAGLSVETLRVWERRYGISNAVRSEHGQRLYSDAQVARLRLMKQLVDQGHAIGALAHLPPDQLSTLPTRPDPAAPARPVRVALVGLPLAQRAAGHDVPGLDVVAECGDLDMAAAAFANIDMDVLLLEVAELDERAMPAIAALCQQRDAAVVVLYRFCASAVIRQLRSLGCLVARAPGDAAEIVLLCQAALPAQSRRTPTPMQAPPMSPPPARRFDDHSLAVLSAARNSIHCDCPRHLSEILLLLNSFERYSSQCAQRTPADAVLHEELKVTAGAARVLLEGALERLARADGLPLPPSLSGDGWQLHCAALLPFT